MIKEYCAGIIPLEWKEDRWSVLLVQLKSGNHWSFPKGHVEPGEDYRQTAQRELLEETGLYVIQWLPFPMLQESYEVIRHGFPVPKTVYYFLGEVTGELALQTEEIADFQWIPLQDAPQKLTYKPSQEIASKAIELLKNFNKHLA